MLTIMIIMSTEAESNSQVYTYNMIYYNINKTK